MHLIRTKLFSTLACTASILAGFVSVAAAQSANTGDEARPASRVGVAAVVSSLGVGVDVAAAVSPRLNARVGFNVFSYGDEFSYHGLDYAVQLNLRSVDAHLDWFPFGGAFHVSPGVMLYDGTRADLNASVRGGQTFTLGDATYTSNPLNPVAGGGGGRVSFNTVRPTFLVGWGNIVPRGDRHVSIPLEIGVVYQGPATATLNLGGSACSPTGADCRDVRSDPGIQADIVAEQNRISSHESSHLYLRFYPVVSLGVSYRF